MQVLLLLLLYLECFQARIIDVNHISRKLDALKVPNGDEDSNPSFVEGEPLGPDDFARAANLSEEYYRLPTGAQDPLTSRYLFEGDIVLPSLQDRNAVRDQNKLWPGAYVPIQISKDYNNEERSVIASGIGQIEYNTCVRFGRKYYERDYVQISKGNGCSSVVGRAGGAQTVSLGDGCSVVGIVCHELMHALGFHHEHNRPDRDNYIKIMTENIQQGQESQFNKNSYRDVTTLGEPYDYYSVMHYSNTAFSKDGKLHTIEPLARGAEIGQRHGLSEFDIRKINILYGCY